MSKRIWMVVVGLALCGAMACDGGGGGDEDTVQPQDTHLDEVATDTVDVVPADLSPEVGPDTVDVVEPQDTEPEAVEDLVEEVADLVDPDVLEPCAAHVECDDADPCTGDVCEDGLCTHQVKDCGDANECTVDLCSPETGQCSYELMDCDDGNGCTLDSCKPATGCETMVVAVSDLAFDGAKGCIVLLGAGRFRAVTLASEPLPTRAVLLISGGCTRHASNIGELGGQHLARGLGLAEHAGNVVTSKTRRRGQR